MLHGYGNIEMDMTHGHGSMIGVSVLHREGSFARVLLICD